MFFETEVITGVCHYQERSSNFYRVPSLTFSRVLMDITRRLRYGRRRLKSCKFAIGFALNRVFSTLSVLAGANLFLAPFARPGRQTDSYLRFAETSDTESAK